MLEAFLATWSDARHTFGQDALPTAEQYDGSARLRDLQATVAKAAPGSAWRGSGANAYDVANADHGEVFGQLAGLDQRLGAQVTESARVVDAGRRNLDAVRRWVVDAAASVPPGRNREQLLMPIMKRGLGQLTDIVTTANGELTAIGGQVRAIAGEYQALGNQKFGPKEGVGAESDSRSPAAIDGG